MRPIIVKKTFRDIKHEIGALKWHDYIPENTVIYDVLYPHGYKIGDHNGMYRDLADVIHINNPLGLLIDGRAELYETYVANKYRVYRPIRIINAGDLIGDFSVLDSICFPKDSYIISRYGETWSICSGFISVIITQRIATDNISKYINEIIGSSTIKSQHRIAHEHMSDDCQARVAFFDASFIQDDHERIVKLFLYSWPRAKMYRDCLNSFNFSQLQMFRQEAKKIIDSKLGVRAGRDANSTNDRYVRALDRTTYMDYFIDAVWDAYNRPIRAEPMFVRATEDALGRAMGKFSEIGVSIDNILIASDSTNKEDLWFPIDMNNYLIAVNYPYFRTEDRGVLVVNDQVNDKAAILMKKIAPKKNKDGARECERDIYKDLCNNFLGILSRSHERYPFEVSCVDRDGIENKQWILMLHFRRRT